MIDSRSAELGRIRRRLYNAGEAQEQYERSTINLIASDNLVPAWREVERPYHGDMIQEGIVGSRPFAGARLHDELEVIAGDIAKAVFGVDHAILQSHSCSQANQAVYHALLRAGDPVLALEFRSGGHLTHGMKANFSGRLYDFHFFGVAPDGHIDYAEVREAALRVRPRLLVCGSSSYPWTYDVEALRAICDEVGAYLMLDVSHEGGLIAAGEFNCDLAVADMVTMSLDKTMRGTHGAAILCRGQHAAQLDAAVHPGTQSSFPIRRLTDAAVALLESQTPGFADYARRAVLLGQLMSTAFQLDHERAVFGAGTQKHYFLLDTQTAFGINGTEAERQLEAVGILTNRQSLPSATTSRLRDAAGVRIGTAWLASAGYDTNDVTQLVDFITRALSTTESNSLSAEVAAFAAAERPLDVRSIANSAK